ncbi:unnamed protein product [Effrenium voratum]|uniref:Uncharacterized protein n=1 Tax=Effrenium voratum TaxID=2562239 RepID=A0AA36MYG0_9DINO|nr:unnamed protein product [Effrenium voratum]
MYFYPSVHFTELILAEDGCVRVLDRSSNGALATRFAFSLAARGQKEVRSTFLNGEQLRKGTPTQLKEGDVISFSENAQRPGYVFLVFETLAMAKLEALKTEVQEFQVPSYPKRKRAEEVVDAPSFTGGGLEGQAHAFKAKAVLCPDLLEELLAEELRSSNEDSFDLFGDGAGAEAEAAALAVEARLETLAGRLCVSDLPTRYRSPAWFLVKEVAGMAIPLVLGCSKQGHGDVIWASAEFAAAALINGELKELPKWPCRVLEVGAGVGLPSAAAARLGAEVVATDIRDHERLLALATSLELNLRLAPESARARVLPHRWGSGCDALCEGGLFDLVLCNDCLYIPDLHRPLLQSLFQCLSPTGTVLVCFSLHRTAPDSAILGFFDLAKDMGFQVEHFGERQLPPRCSNMPLERSYVYARTMQKLP